MIPHPFYTCHIKTVHVWEKLMGMCVSAALIKKEKLPNCPYFTPNERSTTGVYC